MHPDYKKGVSRDRYHDIAILQLKNIVKMAINIFPACLKADGISNYRKLTIAGFGKTESK